MKAVVFHKYRGPEVEGFSVGDRAFSIADDTYAELCVVSGETLPLRQAAEAQAAAEKGVAGKILLVA